MKRYFLALTFCVAILLASDGRAQEAKASQPRVLIFYSLNVETDHVLFALDALRFFATLAEKATSRWKRRPIGKILMMRI